MFKEKSDDVLFDDEDFLMWKILLCWFDNFVFGICVIVIVVFIIVFFIIVIEVVIVMI